MRYAVAVLGALALLASPPRSRPVDLVFVGPGAPTRPPGAFGFVKASVRVRWAGSGDPGILSPGGARELVFEGPRLLVRDLGNGRSVELAPGRLARPPSGAPAVAPAWSPDARRVAFGLWHRGGAGTDEDDGLWIADVEGGGLRRVLASPAYAATIAWSLDKRRLAVESLGGPHGGITVVELATGAARTYAAEFARAGLSWSSDGQRLAYTGRAAARGFAVWTLDLATGVTRRLAPGQDPAWSPASSTIAFVHVPVDPGLDSAPRPCRPGQWLETIRADGSRLARVAPDAYGTPSWSPGGFAIAFLRCGDPDVFAFSPKTRNVRRMTRLSSFAARGAVWLGDGRIAFSAAPPAGPSASELYALRPGGRVRRLTSTTFGAERAPAWSPDGRRIAYARTFLGELLSVYVRDARGGVARRVALGDDPAWSPDGRRLALVTGHLPTQIVLVPAAGGRPRRLVAGSDPSWSPDGSRLAFTLRRRGATQIAVVDLRTRRVRLVTHLPTRTCGAGSFPDASDPAWSPDGRTIVYTRTRLVGCGERSVGCARSTLEAVRPDGAGRRVVVPDRVLAPCRGYASGVAGATWSPDGRELATTLFTSDDPAPRVALVPAGGGRPRVVGPRPSWAPAWRPAG